ncbi:HD-GYP domain-containing protein [Aquabacterium sp.]|uniref:HD-GYP domain-containing protein n=1 Tax=Aquabacterium sp. TaxID=1872578 RepID=UPI002BD82C99|nr:hypothetical protein [Aquabacterium sp.]HSW06007.1 hypothetical protein [Aquabacterium sp.]
MRIVPAPPSAFRAGCPAPFALLDGHGRTLVRKGACLTERWQLNQLLSRGLWMHADDAHRFYRVAATGDPPSGQGGREVPAGASDPMDAKSPEYWQALCARADHLLRDPMSGSFLADLHRLHAELMQRLDENPDLALFALTHLASISLRHYSATHALLCAALLTVAAPTVPPWTTGDTTSLGLAALTMNVSITVVHNAMAAQTRPPTSEQRAMIERHANGATGVLQALGVQDRQWLDAVLYHHDTGAGSLHPRQRGKHLARFLRRADLYAARLSPRLIRPAHSAAEAAQVARLGDDLRPDEAGATIVDAVGLFPPGCYVRLVNGEIGCVVRRGDSATTPRVAVFACSEDSPMEAPITRDTVHSRFAIDFAFAPRDVSVPMPFAALLDLAGSQAA